MDILKYTEFRLSWQIFRNCSMSSMLNLAFYVTLITETRHWDIIKYKAYFIKSPWSKQIHLNILCTVLMINSCYTNRNSREQNRNSDFLKCFLIDCKNSTHVEYEHHEANSHMFIYKFNFIMPIRYHQIHASEGISGNHSAMNCFYFIIL